MRGPRHAGASLLVPAHRRASWLAVLAAFALGVGGCSAVIGHRNSVQRVEAVVNAALDTVSFSAAVPAGAAPTSTRPARVARSDGWFRAVTGVPPRPSSSADGYGGRGASSPLASSGIPSVALTAYRTAAHRAALRVPRCGLTWPLLAAIGRVESDHGRFAGAVLHADGVSTPRIIGIPLDGHGTALIGDTDGGRLDGDTRYDRAVGPMQFIPSTWAGFGVDADHDGVKNPFDVADAAAAAADYLCAAGRDLRTYSGEVRAVRSYNNSDAYIRTVLSLERVYARGDAVTVPTAPDDPDPGKVDGPGGLPPVDPGTPRGVPTGSTSAPPTCGDPVNRSACPRVVSSRTAGVPAGSPVTTPGNPVSSPETPVETQASSTDPAPTGSTDTPVSPSESSSSGVSPSATVLDSSSVTP